MERLHIIANQCSKVNFAEGAALAACPKPSIHLSKTHALVNEKVCISVAGLQANQKVTLQTFVDEGNKSFGSCGHYVADGEGKVNTFDHECHGGTYDGLEPMGLFWSMQSVPGNRPRRIQPTDITRPFEVLISIHLGHVSFEDLPWTNSCRQLSLASCYFYQHFYGEGVKVISVREDGVVGTLFLPAGAGPFPAIVDVFGITPLVPGFRSSLMATSGVASLALNYMEPMKLASQLENMDYSYFLKAFDWLSAHPSINPKALGVMGSCVGAGFASVILWKRPNARCFVSINSATRPDGPTQDVEGELVERTGKMRWELMKEIEGALSWRPMGRVEDNVQSLPYWRHGAKILIIQGEDDQCVNPDCIIASHQAVPAHLKPNVEFVSYPGLGHLICPPYIPLCRKSFDPTFKIMQLWGGQSKEHAHAQEDIWHRIVNFFRKNLMVEESHKDKRSMQGVK